MHTRLGTETQTAAPCDALPRSGPDGPGEEAFVSMHSGRALWLVLVLASCESAPAVPQNVVPQNVVRDSNDLIHVLTSQGYEVSTGYMKLYTPEDCAYSFDVMKNCFANNPTAPYIIPVVKYWPDEYVDPATVDAFGPTAKGYGVSFRLDPREAIIVVGQLPPPAAYFGFQPYLFTRQGTFDTSSDEYQSISKALPELLDKFFSVVPRNPQRIQLGATMENSINNVVIADQSGAAFDQERFFIVTPDMAMEDAIRQALGTISVSGRDVFTEPIPPLARVGLDASADDFAILMRYAEPVGGNDPGTPGARWRQDLPLIVLRVRDPRPHEIQPYEPPVLAERSGVDEHPLAPELDQLVAAVGERWGQPCTTQDCGGRIVPFIDLQLPPINGIGPHCIDIGENCLGDNQDATYQLNTGGGLPLDHGEVYAAISTLGTATGNATYVSLSVNDSYLFKGVTNISSSQLAGSASPFGTVVQDPSQLYVYYLTRDCSGLEALTNGNCLSITEDMLPPCTDPSGATCHDLKLLQRDYVKPGTERGPTPSLLLEPQVLVLKRP